MLPWQMHLPALSREIKLFSPSSLFSQSLLPKSVCPAKPERSHLFPSSVVRARRAHGALLQNDDSFLLCHQLKKRSYFQRVVLECNCQTAFLANEEGSLPLSEVKRHIHQIRIVRLAPLFVQTQQSEVPANQSAFLLLSNIIPAVSLSLNLC